MAVPKKKKSKSRRDMRRSQTFRLDAPNLSTCPNCKAPVLPHHLCDNCGQYQGRDYNKPEAAAQ